MIVVWLGLISGLPFSPHLHVTSYGRFLASIVIIFGYALFGKVTSLITSRPLHRLNISKDTTEIMEELSIIKQTLDRMEKSLVHSHTTNAHISKNKDD